MSPKFLTLGIGILPYDPYRSQTRWPSEMIYLKTVSAKFTLPLNLQFFTTVESFNSQINTYFPLHYPKGGHSQIIIYAI